MGGVKDSNMAGNKLTRLITKLEKFVQGAELAIGLADFTESVKNVMKGEFGKVIKQKLDDIGQMF